MDEKVKNKDAEPEESRTSDLQEGLEDTFPGSDPLSANQPGSKDPDEDNSDKPSGKN